MRKRNCSTKAEAVKTRELPQKLGSGYLSAYTNYAEVGSTPLDFNFTFFEIVEDENGKLVREKQVRIVTTPQHAMSFAQVLNSNLEKWLKKNTTLSDDVLEKIRRGEKV